MCITFGGLSAPGEFLVGYSNRRRYENSIDSERYLFGAFDY
jgi:hypothetical protein